MIHCWLEQVEVKTGEDPSLALVGACDTLSMDVMTFLKASTRCILFLRSRQFRGKPQTHSFPSRGHQFWSSIRLEGSVYALADGFGIMFLISSVFTCLTCDEHLAKRILCGAILAYFPFKTRAALPLVSVAGYLA
jgi:hypothetical protein